MLDRLETRKDTVQVAVDGAFHHAGQIAGIVTRAGREITREIGEWTTELFEMREAARRAEADQPELERTPEAEPAVSATTIPVHTRRGSRRR